jgi:hypothetical protein
LGLASRPCILAGERSLLSMCTATTESSSLYEQIKADCVCGTGIVDSFGQCVVGCSALLGDIVTLLRWAGSVKSPNGGRFSNFGNARFILSHGASCMKTIRDMVKNLSATPTLDGWIFSDVRACNEIGEARLTARNLGNAFSLTSYLSFRSKLLLKPVRIMDQQQLCLLRHRCLFIRSKPVISTSPMRKCAFSSTDTMSPILQR